MAEPKRHHDSSNHGGGVSKRVKSRGPITEPRFITSLNVKALGSQYAFAHRGSTYKVAGRELLTQVLYDMYRQAADGKEWLAPSGKAMPPYHPMHEPTDAFKAALDAALK